MSTTLAVVAAVIRFIWVVGAFGLARVLGIVGIGLGYCRGTCVDWKRMREDIKGVEGVAGPR